MSLPLFGRRSARCPIFALLVIVVLTLFLISSSPIRVDLSSRFVRSALVDELKSFYNVPIDEDQVDHDVKAFDIGLIFTVKSHKSIDCKRRPRFDNGEVKFNNFYWQEMYTSKSVNATTFYIYNAYLDTRGRSPIVRILTYSTKLIVKGVETPKFCQFWYKDHNRVSIGKVVRVDSPWIWGGYGHFPYLISCELRTPSKKEKKIEFPVSVSLVMKPCELATNDVKISYENRKRQEDFGICFKVLDFPATNIADTLIEMLELLKLFGVGGVHFPILSVTPETMKVLRHYESSGFATLKHFSLPGSRPNSPLLRRIYLNDNIYEKRRLELIPYNDCFLSNLYRFKYIGILDVDEILLPVRHNTYAELFKTVPNGRDKSYCFDLKQFLNVVIYNRTQRVTVDKSRFPNALQTRQRNTPKIMKYLFYDDAVVCNEHRSRNTKCFHPTEDLLLLHNHLPIKCREGVRCRTVHVNITTAYLYHYRGRTEYCDYDTSVGLEKLQNPFGYDPRILDFKGEVVERRDREKLRMSLSNFPVVAKMY